DKTLASPRRLQSLLRKELEQDAEHYGDARRSPLVARHPAQAMAETVLVPSEPVPVELPQKGGGGEAKGAQTHPALARDATGRTYALPAHPLPSARGQGEPLTGRLSPPEGASCIAVMLGDAEDLYLLASDASYGFVVSLGDLYARP